MRHLKYGGQQNLIVSRSQFAKIIHEEIGIAWLSHKFAFRGIFDPYRDVTDEFIYYYYY